MEVYVQPHRMMWTIPMILHTVLAFALALWAKTPVLVGSAHLQDVPFVLQPEDTAREHLRRSVQQFRSLMGPMGKVPTQSSALSRAALLPNFQYSTGDVADMTKFLSFGHASALGPLSSKFEEYAKAEAEGLRNSFGSPAQGHSVGSGARLYGKVQMPVSVFDPASDGNNAALFRRRIFHDWCKPSHGTGNRTFATKHSQFHLFTQTRGHDPVSQSAFCPGRAFEEAPRGAISPLEAQMLSIEAVEPRKLLACTHGAVDLVMQNTPGFVDSFAVCIVKEQSAELLALWRVVRRGNEAGSVRDREGSSGRFAEVVELQIVSQPDDWGNYVRPQQSVSLTYHLNHRPATADGQASRARRDMWRHFRLDHGKPGTRLDIEAHDLFFASNVSSSSIVTSVEDNLTVQIRWAEVYCHLSAHNFQLFLNISTFDDIPSDEAETKIRTTGTHAFDVESIWDLEQRRLDGHTRCLSFSVPSSTDDDRQGGGGNGSRWTACLEDAQSAASLVKSVKALQTAFDAVDFGPD